MLDIDEMSKKSGQYVVLWQDLLSDIEVEKVHELAKKYKKERAKTLNVEFGKIDSNIRRSDARWIKYDENSKWLYEKVSSSAKAINDEVYGFELIGAQPFQYTIYDSSEEGHYDWHQDVIDCDNNNIRKISVVILLSDKTEFSGGSFLVSPDGNKPKEILMKKGRMIIFPSWIPHCVTPVLEGVRVSLVMWLYGKRFK
jgi:PKHD-type hydroxylase